MQHAPEEQNKVSQPEVSAQKAEQEPTAKTASEEESSLKKPSKQEQAQRKPKARRPSVWRDLVFLLMKVLSIVMAYLLLFTFLYGIIRYQEPAMAPAIKDGDLVLFYRYTEAGYLPQDVIVLDYEGQRQARRVVATAGDTVDITEAGLVINGALQQETDIYQKTERYIEGVSFPLTVPEGQVFVLGDSRMGATDSRIYGCVNVEDTFGKVMTVIRRRSI